MIRLALKSYSRTNENIHAYLLPPKECAGRLKEIAKEIQYWSLHYSITAPASLNSSSSSTSTSSSTPSVSPFQLDLCSLETTNLSWSDFIQVVIDYDTMQHNLVVDDATASSASATSSIPHPNASSFSLLKPAKTAIKVTQDWLESMVNNTSSGASLITMLDSPCEKVSRLELDFQAAREHASKNQKDRLLQLEKLTAEFWKETSAVYQLIDSSVEFEKNLIQHMTGDYQHIISKYFDADSSSSTSSVSSSTAPPQDICQFERFDVLLAQATAANNRKRGGAGKDSEFQVASFVFNQWYKNTIALFQQQDSFRVDLVKWHEKLESILHGFHSTLMESFSKTTLLSTTLPGSSPSSPPPLLLPKEMAQESYVCNVLQSFSSAISLYSTNVIQSYDETSQQILVKLEELMNHFKTTFGSEEQPYAKKRATIKKFNSSLRDVETNILSFFTAIPLESWALINDNNIILKSYASVLEYGLLKSMVQEHALITRAEMEWVATSPAYKESMTRLVQVIDGIRRGFAVGVTSLRHALSCCVETECKRVMESMSPDDIMRFLASSSTSAAASSSADIDPLPTSAVAPETSTKKKNKKKKKKNLSENVDQPPTATTTTTTEASVSTYVDADPEQIKAALEEAISRQSVINCNIPSGVDSSCFNESIASNTIATNSFLPLLESPSFTHPHPYQLVPPPPGLFGGPSLPPPGLPTLSNIVSRTPLQPPPPPPPPPGFPSIVMSAPASPMDRIVNENIHLKAINAELSTKVAMLENRIRNMELSQGVVGPTTTNNSYGIWGPCSNSTSNNKPCNKRASYHFSSKHAIRCGNCGSQDHESVGCKAGCRYCGNLSHLSEQCPSSGF